MMNKNDSKNLPAKVTGKKKYQWTKKKIIAASIIGTAVLSFVIFMTVVIVMQLGPVRAIKSSKEEARVVGQVAGVDVKYEELRYVTLLHRQSLDNELGKYENLDESGKAEYVRLLEERVLDDIKSNYIVFSLCGKYGIDTDSKEAKNYVQDSIESLVETEFDGDKKAYKAWLAENNMTDAFLRLTYNSYYLETALLNHLAKNKIGIEYDATTKNGLVEHILNSDEWARTIHIFYPNYEIKGLKYDYTRAYELALNDYNVLIEIADGEERFNTIRPMIGRYPMVEGVSTSGNGLYFTSGQTDAEYEAAAFALTEYGVSEPIEMKDGYYIIMRLPKVEDHIRGQSDTLLSQYKYAALKKQLDAEEKVLSFVGNEYFDGISLINIK